MAVQVRYRVSGTEGWSNWGLPVEGPPVTITGLAPGGDYDLQAVTVDATGDFPSDILQVRTLGASTLPTGPGNFSVDTDPHLAVLTWDLLTGTLPIAYTTKYRAHGVSTWIPFGGAVAQGPVTITGLIESTSYDFQLTASNVAGSTVFETTKATPTTPTAPSAPLNVSLEMASQSAVVTWDPSLLGTAPKEYTTQYRESGDIPWLDGPAPSLATTATVTGLVSQTKHEFLVTATNMAGSKASNVASGTTLGTTWNPADKSAEIVLSNGNLTAANFSGKQRAVRSFNAKNSGKYYVSFVVNSITEGNIQLGIANSTFVLGTLGGSPNAFGVSATGAGRINSVVLDSSRGEPWTIGGSVEQVHDFDTMRNWTRANGGTWGDPPDPVVSGSQDTGVVDPVITGPASITMAIGQTVTLSTLSVTDAAWPHVGDATLDVSCDTGGTVAITKLGGVVTQTKDEMLSYADSDAHLVSAINTTKYTAPSSPGLDTIVIEVFDQVGGDSILSIPVTITSNPDPETGVGGFDISSLGAGPYFVTHSSSQNGSTITANFGASSPPYDIPIDVPTWDSTIVSLPGDVSGTAALRVADTITTWGTNCFPDGNDGGSGAGTNTAAAFQTAFTYLTAGTKQGMRNRIYDIGTDQSLIPRQVSAAMPAIDWYVCYAQGSTAASVIASAEAMRAAGCLWAVEGANEPNNSLVGGGTALTSTECVTINQALFNHFQPLGVPVIAASVVDNTGSDAYAADYYSANLAQAISSGPIYNGHDYPNSGAPYVDMHRRTGFLVDAGWPSGGIIGEFHPLLYNGSVIDEATGAYWMLCAFLSGIKHYGLKAFTFYNLYDYPGFPKPVGLFHGADPTNPRAYAKVIRNMFSKVIDTGIDRLTFTPTKLDVTTTGMPAALSGAFGGPASGGGQTLLLQGSNGLRYYFQWNQRSTLNLSHTDPVVHTFNAGPHNVVDWSLTNPITDTPVAKQTLSGVSVVNQALTTEVRLLVID